MSALAEATTVTVTLPAPVQEAPRSTRRERCRAAAEIADQVAATHAGSVDREARFPQEAIDALKAAGLLSIAVPERCGGAGAGLGELCEISYLLGKACAATGMVWAMHCIQVACLARHSSPGASPRLESYLAELCRTQGLIASITSEVGVGGDIRTSLAALQITADGQASFQKQAPTISYGRQADAYLTTVLSSDADGVQVLALTTREQTELECRGVWDTLGMRGTCSPPFLATAEFDAAQILPIPFGAICTETMTPYSHTLWASAWLGIARAAFAKARAFLRKAKSPEAAQLVQLSEAAARLQSLEGELNACIEAVDCAEGGLAPASYAVQLNNLKINTSRGIVQVVMDCLSVTGVAGYKNDSPYSLGRHLRDALSAACMIGNHRLLSANADLALLQRGDAALGVFGSEL